MIKNKKRDWNEVVITDEASFYLLSQIKHRWVALGNFIRMDKNKVLPKDSSLGAFSSKGIIKLQFFTANMDSKKYAEILKNCKSDIDNLHPNNNLLLSDND